VRNIYILSEYINKAENSTGYYWNAIIQSISKKFGKVHVICPLQNHHYISSEGSIDYVYVNRNVFSDGRLPTRILNQLMQSLRFAFCLARRVKKNDIVICGTNPTLFILLVPFLKRLKGFTWVLIVYDLFPENLVPAKILANDGLAFKFLKVYCNWVYKFTDKIIVIGRDMEYLVNKKTYPHIRTSLITNWANPNEVSVVAKQDALFIKDLGWQKKVVFQFFGNMGRVQGIDNILSAISCVTDSRAAFLFIGDGAMVAEITDFIDKNPSISIAYFGSISIDQRNYALAACDVAIITLASGMFGLGVPSKSYFSLAADRPLLVIAEPESEICNVVNEDKVGWTCKPNNPVELASIIESICSLDLSTYKGIPRQVLIEKYSESIALEKYNAAIEELLNP
jgi:glycosyltransferase involved in cell wall biosynthesis